MLAPFISLDSPIVAKQLLLLALVRDTFTSRVISGHTLEALVA